MSDERDRRSARPEAEEDSLFNDQPLFGDDPPESIKIKRPLQFSWRRVGQLTLMVGLLTIISFLIGFHMDIQSKTRISKILLQSELLETQANITMEFYAQHLSGLVRAYVRMGGELMPSKAELLQLEKGSNILIDPYDPRQRVYIIDVDYDGQPIYEIDDKQLYNKIGYYTDNGVAVKIFLWDRQGSVAYRTTLTLSSINLLLMPPYWLDPEGNDSYITPEQFQDQSRINQGGA